MNDNYLDTGIFFEKDDRATTELQKTLKSREKKAVVTKETHKDIIEDKEIKTKKQ